MTEFILGNIVGMVQTIVGYPLDTLKVIRQKEKYIKLVPLNPVRLYKGIQYPLLGNSIVNGISFYTYNKTYQYTKSVTISGFMSGVCISPVLNIIEVYKVRSQLLLPMYERLFLAYKYTLLRESIACSFYFSTYYKLKDNNINSFIGGALAGVASWTSTYPIDVIKTRIQSGIVLKEAINMGNYWRGYNFCIFRAILVNGLSFGIYDLSKNII